MQRSERSEPRAWQIMQLSLIRSSAMMGLVVALMLCAFGCAPALGGQEPQGAPQPASTPQAAPPLPFPPEPSEATCLQLIAVPGDGVSSIMLKVSREESAGEVLGQFVRLTDEWFRCAPRFRSGPEEVRSRAIGALRHLAGVVERWYDTKGLVRLRSHELLGALVKQIPLRIPGPMPDLCGVRSPPAV